MCGICGTIGVRETGLVEAMNNKMSHRGPDHTGMWRDGNVCLGHTRLSIIDISSAGHQPMYTQNNSACITFNGEIYNFKSLRKKLEGKYCFKSDTDTEVILHLYEEYGEKCLEYLRGMFAFAIWDKSENKLFAARDRFGIKPFFYYFKDNVFMFSSELKPLLASNFIANEINSKSLRDYFIYGFVQTPYTLVRNIFQLEPAHCLIFKDNRITLKKYWQTCPKAKKPIKTESDYVSEIKAILDDTVGLHMVSDVPLGVFLSGGVDSSTIAALMQKHSPRPIKSFSVIFEEEGYDERRFSRMVARALGTNHSEILVKGEYIVDKIPDIFDAMDQPSIDGFNTFIISEAVKKNGVRVVLSGLGADELFAGYSSFRILPKISRTVGLMKIIPQMSKNNLFKVLMPLIKTRRDLKGLFSILKCANLEDLHFMKRMVFLPDETERFLAISDIEQTSNNILEGTNAIDAVNILSLLELRTYLQDMLLPDTDRMSMANSLEVRVPFLDHVLVEKMFEIPGRMKVRRGYPKYLLVKATAGLLPEEIYNRPKMGFVFPFERWLKGKLRDYCEEKFSKSSLKNINFLDSDKVNRIWFDFLKGSKLYNYSSILSLLSFINWYERIDI